jgi:hypothetical protein
LQDLLEFFQAGVGLSRHGEQAEQNDEQYRPQQEAQHRGAGQP